MAPLVAALRARYADVKAALAARPPADPLSPAWDRMHADAALRSLIAQDTARTFQDLPLFRRPDVLATLGDVLFVWSRQNADVGYRQGMHEVAAVALWMLLEERGGVALPPTEDDERPDVWSLLESPDPANIEADVHTLFSLIMSLLLLPFYRHRAPPVATALGTALAVDSLPKSPTRPTPLLVTSARIFHEHLARTDPQLYRALRHCGVEEQVWGVRWLRLLFSREVAADGFNGAVEDDVEGWRTARTLRKICEMWTCIFAAAGLGQGVWEETGRSVIEWTAVEMLISVRDKILSSSADPTAALHALLKYTPPAPLDALHPARFVLRALNHISDLEPGGPVRTRSNGDPQESPKPPVANSVEGSPIYAADLRAESAQPATSAPASLFPDGTVGKRLDSLVQGFVRSARASPIKNLWMLGGAPTGGIPFARSESLAGQIKEPMGGPAAVTEKNHQAHTVSGTNLDKDILDASLETALHVLSVQPVTDKAVEEAVRILNGIRAILKPATDAVASEDGEWVDATAAAPQPADLPSAPNAAAFQDDVGAVEALLESLGAGAGTHSSADPCAPPTRAAENEQETHGATGLRSHNSTDVSANHSSTPGAGATVPANLPEPSASPSASAHPLLAPLSRTIPVPALPATNLFASPSALGTNGSVGGVGLDNEGFTTMRTYVKPRRGLETAEGPL
ncbi:hypothetical protein DFJ74DRAFT_644468 [Hyaloraphidium curvatum]|nr:hypothetical protein DFJ74DRAFT_644468 [Hyaloraphidium curvatum]